MLHLILFNYCIFFNGFWKSQEESEIATEYYLQFIFQSCELFFNIPSATLNRHLAITKDINCLQALKFFCLIFFKKKNVSKRKKFLFRSTTLYIFVRTCALKRVKYYSLAIKISYKAHKIIIVLWFRNIKKNKQNITNINIHSLNFLNNISKHRF